MHQSKEKYNPYGKKEPSKELEKKFREGRKICKREGHDSRLKKDWYTGRPGNNNHCHVDVCARCGKTRTLLTTYDGRKKLQDPERWWYGDWYIREHWWQIWK